jgi:hypothetical protein
LGVLQAANCGNLKTGTNSFRSGVLVSPEFGAQCDQWELNHTFNPKTGQPFTPIPGSMTIVSVHGSAGLFA